MNPCPVEYALETLSGKWKMHIMFVLSKNETSLFNELQLQVGNISAHMLSRSLRELEKSGLVNRIEYDIIPPHVEYILPNLPKELVPAINSLGRLGSLVWEANNTH
ncbi:helix-turn-helix transcriptional regulator [Listeria monocytogenes]|nr:transcriptional regulator [Listeria monocytogenes]EGK1785247.1 helix-turn-helix transcriptional regulator [Listeria monocytogenes]EGN2098090.1 helix-turn-helix transcriptional regulator [Listeria monocytogenes]